MKNRKLSTPILSAIVLTLLGGAPLISRGQTDASSPGFQAPAVQDPSSPAPTTSASSTTAAAPAKHTTSYTVVAGDSLSSIARKFNTTRKKIRALNGLDVSFTKVKPGQILLVPFTEKTASAKAKAHHSYLVAQPVQDFDVPASTFASCPVPLPSPEDDPQPAPDATTTDTAAAPDSDGKPAPIAKLVSPSEMAAEPPVEVITPDTPIPPVTEPEPRVTESSPVPARAPIEPNPIQPTPKPAIAYSSGSRMASIRAEPVPVIPPPPLAPVRPPHRTLAQILGFASSDHTGSNDWGNRFLQQARALGNEGIEYDDDWRPPGESHSWVMDCSNTTRYLYKVTAGIQLPRTASDQYYYLHLQGKAWDVPLNPYGLVDTTYLREHLKPGDLLFWENTYRPERQPPITHVMVYLGTNAQGQWLMAGSQSSRGGEHNRRNGGPDVYVFRPSQPCGGYTTWMGLVHHTGRFCAFGRPLEADPSKLAVAESD